MRHSMLRPIVAKRLRTTATALVMLLALTLVIPVVATASYSFTLGGEKKFGGSVSDGLAVTKKDGKYSIGLKRVLVWKLEGAAGFDPRSAQRLTDGHTLVADSAGARVIEYDENGKAVWSYDTGDNPTLLKPYHAQRLASTVSGQRGNTLIVDREGRSVIEVDSSKKVVWRYGTGAHSTDSGALSDPVYAVRLAGGNTLIADNDGGHRVIEVRTSDYDPALPSDGYLASSVVWRFGVDGVEGNTNGRVAAPRHAQRLPNGNTLIADEEAHHVIEVDPSGTIVWQYGKAGVRGSDSNRLDSPTAAQRQSDGTTLITDSGNARIIRVSSNLKTIEKINTGTAGSLRSPQSAIFTPTGTVLLADQDNHRLLEFGNASSGRHTTGKLDLGTAGVKKRLTRIDAMSTRPTKTAVKLQYSVNGGKWKSVGGPTISFPTGLNATYVRVRTELSTTNRDVSPVLSSIVITYDLLPTAGTAGSTWANTYGQGLGPFAPGARPAQAPGPETGAISRTTKAPGAASALPQGSAVPGVAATSLYSGFLMQRVANGAQMTKDPRGLPGLPIEGAATAAALLLMTTVYSLGLASTTLSKVAHGALGALKSVLLRSM